MKALITLLFFVGLSGAVPKSSSQAWNVFGAQHMVEKALSENSYNPLVRPEKLTNVSFGVSIINTRLITEKSKLKINLWGKFFWKDHRLAWKSGMDGFDNFHVPAKFIWVPDVSVYQNTEGTTAQEFSGEVRAVVRQGGDVIWVPPAKVEVFCNLADHPDYDENTLHCKLSVGFWTYSGLEVDILEYSDSGFGETCDTKYYYNIDPEWNLVECIAVRVEKFYDCCPGVPYPVIEFHLKFTRLEGSTALHQQGRHQHRLQGVRVEHHHHHHRGGPEQDPATAVEGEDSQEEEEEDPQEEQLIGAGSHDHAGIGADAAGEASIRRM